MLKVCTIYSTEYFADFGRCCSSGCYYMILNTKYHNCLTVFVHTFD